MIMPKQITWWSVAGLTLVLGSILAFLYSGMQGHDAADYFQNVALLRQIKQLDAEWELNTLKSKIGIHTDYDPLVDPLTTLHELQQQLETVEHGRQGNHTSALVSNGREAFHDALEEKTRLVERFKSHNAVLRNSLAFLPIAGEDIEQSLSRATESNQATLRKVSETVRKVLLASMAYSLSASGDRRDEIQAALDSLAVGKGNLPTSIGEQLDLFAAHVRTVLGEHTVVSELLNRIAAVPTATHIDDISNKLSSEQERARVQDEHYRRWLLIFATALIGLLLYAAAQLIRSHDALRKAHGELERRVDERTRQLKESNERLEVEIAERKSTEVVLAQRSQELARSNADLEQFAYVASHDLQEPLRMVGSYLQLLERRYKDRLDADANEFIAFAVDGAKRMQSLIIDLLTYSRVGAKTAPFKETDCAVVLATVMRNLALAIEESDAKITHDPLPTVLADAMQMTQLFQNLIANAIKFRGDRPPEIHLHAIKGPTHWEFAIRDNGIGIAHEYLDKMFILFKRLHNRTAYPGTGIGLAICKKIAEQHGGRIWIESEPGEGTTFNFTILRTQQDIH
jgi:signal transduction histidine kinase